MKVFTCPKKGCGSNQFILADIKNTLIDFSREGAIEGRPHAEDLATSTASVFCMRCNKRVPLDMAIEIIKEVV